MFLGDSCVHWNALFSGLGERNDPLGHETLSKPSVYYHKHSVIRSAHFVRTRVTPDYFSDMSSLHRTVQATENVTLILVIFKLLLTNERLLGPQRVEHKVVMSLKSL